MTSVFWLRLPTDVGRFPSSCGSLSVCGSLIYSSSTLSVWVVVLLFVIVPVLIDMSAGVGTDTLVGYTLGPAGSGTLVAAGVSVVVVELT